MIGRLLLMCAAVALAATLAFLAVAAHIPTPPGRLVVHDEFTRD